MIFSYFALTIVGIIAGGVVNALADDLPHRRNPSLPKYPDGTPRPFIAWLGITAFLTGKRQSPNGAKLSWRYPLAEIATIVLMVLLVNVKADNPLVTDLQRVFWLIYMPIFVLITVIDMEHHLILFIVIIPTAILTLIDAALTSNNYYPTLSSALIGGAIGFGVFFLFYLGGFLFTYIIGQMRGQPINTVAFGYGDVMLITVSGFMVGLESILVVLYVAIFLGALGAIVYLVVKAIIGQRYSWFTALPYGPYIIASTLLMIIFTLEMQKALLHYCNPVPC